MDVEEDDGFHSLDEEDKIFDEIKQEILDEESMYKKFLKLYFHECILLYKMICLYYSEMDM